MDDQDRDLIAVTTFLDSPLFRRFLDENLRRFAEDRVSRFMADNEKYPKKSQLHSIPAVVSSEGIQGLTDLAKHQSEKNTRKENKTFWIFFKEIFDDPSGNGDSLEKAVGEFLRECGMNIPRQKGAIGRQKTMQGASRPGTGKGPARLLRTFHMPLCILHTGVSHAFPKRYGLENTHYSGYCL